MGPVFVAHGQTPELAEPGQGAFHYPPVPAQSGAAVNATPRDARLDATAGQGCAAAAVIVSLVGVEFGGPPARAAQI